MASRQKIDVSFESFLCQHFDNGETKDELRAFHCQNVSGTSYFGLECRHLKRFPLEMNRDDEVLAVYPPHLEEGALP
jgi:hypothetical protein